MTSHSDSPPAPGAPRPARRAALVRTPVAPMLAEPRVAATQLSQALFGRLVLGIARDGDWWRIRTPHDGYEGWTHAGYLAELADVEALGDLAEHGASHPAGVAAGGAALSLGCTVRAGGRTLRLPLGAWVFAEQAVVEGETVAHGELAARFACTGGAVVESARRWFEGTAYQWGGVTPWGADCSGFVQAVFGLHGVELPRDAWQQAMVGRPVDGAPGDPAAAPAGALHFFTDRDDRRPTHVGLAAGDGTMLHVALGRGGWAEDDLADAGDPYVARLRQGWLGARRVL